MRITIGRWSSAGAGVLLMACSGVVVAPSDGQSQLADGYAALGRAQYEATRYGDALRSYRRAVELAPHHVNARNGLAAIYAGQGDLKQAIALWRAAIDDGGAGADGAFLAANLGYAYLLDGDAAQAAALLEQACVLDPLDALSWEHLGRALEKLGQGERAAAMLKQARTLRLHDARSDYAALPAPLVVPALGAPLVRSALAAPSVSATSSAAATAGDGAASARPPGTARTELTQTGAMVEVRRVSYSPVSVSVPAPVPAPLSTRAGVGPRNDDDGAAPPPPSRLEISNGNGVTGMAAALARTIGAREWKVVRLSNLKPYTVPFSRVEYGVRRRDAARALAERLGLPILREHDSHAGLRVVLGRDRRDPLALARRYRQRPAGQRIASAPE
ncbi:LytR C-terminal domain-containing protein [Rugamonas sp.]|uniref:LytR C-terminal domain-containing protein n=1 Tax=Rugamonas sp. TaxID=1926287 RepID=UPI0025EB5C68|nr:LytR C-terminal domain-containing protein [Rugamonas sp.]